MDKHTQSYTPLVTEIKRSETFGFVIHLSDNTCYGQRVKSTDPTKDPLDDSDEVTISLCESWLADRSRIQLLEGALSGLLAQCEQGAAYHGITIDSQSAESAINEARDALSALSPTQERG